MTLVARCCKISSIRLIFIFDICSKKKFFRDMQGHPFLRIKDLFLHLRDINNLPLFEQ